PAAPARSRQRAVPSALPLIRQSPGGCHWSGSRKKKEARDTLALPAKGVALCTPTHHSICGPAARWHKKKARDTLALPAKDVALCTPTYEWMSVSKPFTNRISILYTLYKHVYKLN